MSRVSIPEHTGEPRPLHSHRVGACVADPFVQDRPQRRTLETDVQGSIGRPVARGV